MRASVITFFLMLFAGYSSGKTAWTDVNKFVPEGYDTLYGGFIAGDLNKDGMEDMVLALRPLAEEEENEEAKRLLIVLLNNGHGYKIAGRSSEVLMCKGCGGVFGDPWEGIGIEKGILVIHHYGGSAWRWSDTKKYRYQDNGMYLIGSTSDYYWNVSDCNGEGVGDAGREYRDTNWVTGDEEYIKRDEDCKLITHTKKKLKKQPLQRLEQFKS